MHLLHSAFFAAPITTRGKVRYCTMEQIKGTLTVYTFDTDWSLKIDNRMYLDLVAKLRVFYWALLSPRSPRRGSIERNCTNIQLTAVSPQIDLYASFTTDTIAKMGAISLSVHYLEILSKPGQGRGRGRALGDSTARGEPDPIIVSVTLTVAKNERVNPPICCHCRVGSIDW